MTYPSVYSLNRDTATLVLHVVASNEATQRLLGICKIRQALKHAHTILLWVAMRNGTQVEFPLVPWIHCLHEYRKLKSRQEQP